MVYLDQLIRNVAVHKCHHAKKKYLCSSCFIRSIHVCMDRMRWRNVLLLVAGYSCAYQSDILIQGSLYISPNWFCFHSKILGIKTEVCRPIHRSTHALRHRDVIILNILCFVAAVNSCQHSSQHIAREDGHFYSERHRNPHNKRQSECNIWLPVSIKTTLRRGLLVLETWAQRLKTVYSHVAL